MMRSLREVLFEVAKPIIRRVDKFRDQHRGDACYIFGDGISLKWFDLRAFPLLPSFVLSYLFFHRDVDAIGRPVYGLLTESRYFYPYFRLPWPPRTLWRNRIQEEFRRVVASRRDAQFFVSLASYPVMRGENVFHLFRSIPGSAFCDACRAAGQDVYHGSLRSAITLAIHMGFSQIYLVGCDYTHRVSRSLHWYEIGRGVLTEHPEYNRGFFEVAQRFTSITTVTIEPGSDVLPYVTYERLTGATPIFRENTELTEARLLDLLGTWPGYRVR